MLTLAMPQSLPAAERKRSALRRLVVMMAEESPCTTPFCMAMASSRVSYFITYRMGANVSCWTMAMSLVASAMAGLT